MVLQVVPKCRLRKKTLCVEAFESCPCHSPSLVPPDSPVGSSASAVGSLGRVSGSVRSSPRPCTPCTRILTPLSTRLLPRFIPWLPFLPATLSPLWPPGSLNPLKGDGGIFVCFLNNLSTVTTNKTRGTELTMNFFRVCIPKGQLSILVTSLSFGPAVSVVLFFMPLAKKSCRNDVRTTLP